MLLQPYQPTWPSHFLAISEVLANALAGLDVTIEHIGSTAVPQLAAKPIIDIDIVMHEQQAWDVIKDRLEQCGYYHNGNQGIPDREVFKRQQSANPHPVLDTIVHHLYVCPAHSEALQAHLLFRDYLRADATARLAYQTLKYAIAAGANQDRKLYAQLKEIQARDFVQRVVTQAKKGNSQ